MEDDLKAFQLHTSRAWVNGVLAWNEVVDIIQWLKVREMPFFYTSSIKDPRLRLE